MLPKANFYVRVYVNRVTVKNIDTGRYIDRSSEEPFSTIRLLIGDFAIAEEFLRNTLKEVMPDSWLPPVIRMLIQPMEMTEGGLSSVELRAFIDLGEQGGGQVVKIFQEPNLLSDYEVREIINSKDSNF